jgi:GEVED domain/Secretion system C-terminal sorting domain
MKNFTIASLLLLCQLLPGKTLNAQCTAASNNWDYADYLISTGLYAGYVSPAMAATQKFAIGPSYFTIATTGLTLFGDTVLHTGDVGSNGTGEDIRYSGNGTITITFKDSANSMLFSLYDLDVSHVAAITATSPTGIARTITLTTPGTLTIAGSPGTAPTATSAATAVAVTANTRTLNVSVAGFVKTLVITLTGGGDAEGVFLSDISACVPGSFPTNYYNIAKPFTGMPAYGFATSDTNTVHVLDLTTAVATEQFIREPAFRFINSLAYDPYGHDLYYVEDGNVAPTTNRALKKYDYDSETSSIVVSDVTTIGIPLFDKGVQSAASTYYGGQLYFGVEGGAPATSSPRENIIWRIELDTIAGTILSVCQVYAQKTFDATLTASHDWGDMTIKDGLMYDFNAVNALANNRFYHYNLQTGAMVNAYVATTYHRARQTGQRWDGRSFNVWDSLSIYNDNGTLGTKTRITGTGWRGTCGDASGPFKPKTDFGDAPATYDPGPGDPATHLRDTAIRLGATFDREWAPMPSIWATGDGTDEDGIISVSVLSSSSPQTFWINVSVYNNTGATANLVAWLDYNEDGLFNAGEGVSTTVGSMAAQQTRTLTWTSISTPTLAAGDLTFIRVRISTGALTTSTPNGYFSNGEVEDYPVVVDVVLPTKLLSFDAYKYNDNQVKIDWSTISETGLKNYEVQHSVDGQAWSTIGTANVSGSSQVKNDYSVLHRQPAIGKNYYRLKINETQGDVVYSAVKTIYFYGTLSLNLQPNPAKNTTNVVIATSAASNATVEINDMQGRRVYTKAVRLNAGTNNIVLDHLPASAGAYMVKVIDKDEVLGMGKLIIN